jgi:hypothetical protein
VHVIEVIEESRAQKSDAEVMVLKPLEVTNQIVCDFYNRNRTDARLEKTATYTLAVDLSIHFGHGFH